MSKTSRFVRAGWWAGTALLVVICCLPLAIAGKLDFDFFSDEPESDSSGWPRKLAEKNYYDDLTDIVAWDDFCDTAMIDELVSYTGDAPAREPDVPNESLYSSDLHEDWANIRFACDFMVASRDCGGPPEQLNAHDSFRVYFSPNISEERASAAYGISLGNTSSSQEAAFVETRVGPPWRDGMVTSYFADGRWNVNAIALGDFYTVGLYVSRADQNCSSDAAELVHVIAEEFMPLLHASIEERIAADE